MWAVCRFAADHRSYSINTITLLLILLNLIFLGLSSADSRGGAFATQTSVISGAYDGGDAYGTNGFGDAKTLIEFTKGGIDLDSAVSSTDDHLQFANHLMGLADHMAQSVMANNQLDSVHYSMGFSVEGKFLTDIDIKMMR